MPQPEPTMPNRGGPLAGIRVLEITKVWAGPYAGKILAALGAEVIKVESATNLDEMRAYGGVDINSAPYFLSINQEILSVQVNMKTDEGLELVRQMVASSDVVIDNIRPGAMERSAENDLTGRAATWAIEPAPAAAGVPAVIPGKCVSDPGFGDPCGKGPVSGKPVSDPGFRKRSRTLTR